MKADFPHESVPDYFLYTKNSPHVQKVAQHSLDENFRRYDAFARYCNLEDDSPTQKERRANLWLEDDESTNEFDHIEFRQRTPAIFTDDEPSYDF